MYVSTKKDEVTIQYTLLVAAAQGFHYTRIQRRTSFHTEFILTHWLDKLFYKI